VITNVKLIKKEPAAGCTMAFYFAKPDGFDFRTGQFIDYTPLDPTETDEEGNTRGFSLVLAPYKPELVAACGCASIEGFADRYRN